MVNLKIPSHIHLTCLIILLTQLPLRASANTCEDLRKGTDKVLLMGEMKHFYLLITTKYQVLYIEKNALSEIDPFSMFMNSSDSRVLGPIEKAYHEFANNTHFESIKDTLIGGRTMSVSGVEYFELDTFSTEEYNNSIRYYFDGTLNKDKEPLITGNLPYIQTKINMMLSVYQNRRFYMFSRNKGPVMKMARLERTSFVDPYVSLERPLWLRLCRDGDQIYSEYADTNQTCKETLDFFPCQGFNSKGMIFILCNGSVSVFPENVFWRLGERQKFQKIPVSDFFKCEAKGLLKTPSSYTESGSSTWATILFTLLLILLIVNCLFFRSIRHRHYRLYERLSRIDEVILKHHPKSQIPRSNISLRLKMKSQPTSLINGTPKTLEQFGCKEHSNKDFKTPENPTMMDNLIRSRLSIFRNRTKRKTHQSTQKSEKKSDTLNRIALLQANLESRNSFFRLSKIGRRKSKSTLDYVKI